MYLENYVRYTFVRYGVPYVVAIECFDGGARFRKMSCRDADKVAVRFLKALRIAGGTPQERPETIVADTIDRPLEQSDGLHLSRPRGHPSRHRLQAQRRRRGLHRLFQDPLPDRRCAGLRQFPVLHELG